MNMYDIILKQKQHSVSLTKEEIEWLVRGCTDGTIPDYQISAWLMAVCFNSMSERETADLTMAMANSGDMLDLSCLGGFTVDKHSTGGVGDKTTLVIVPAVAACGVLVPKMSGRGLGHTGGTIDKLESIPGFCADLSFEKFVSVMKETNCAVGTQTGHLTPADKKLYALRDTTATVDSIPLIASSVMSKKLATGANGIVLDVKAGSGAFMKSVDDARELARLMVKIAVSAGRKCCAVISNMDAPLGRMVGNSLEVIEAVEILKGNDTDGDFYKLCIELAGNMLCLAGKGTLDECRRFAAKAISSGEALGRFRRMVELQGGNTAVIDDYSLFPQPKHTLDILAPESGYISHINCQECGLTAQMLGAGRAVKNALVDHSAGIILHKHVGNYVEKGEKLATLCSSAVHNIQECGERFVKSYEFNEKLPENIAIVIKEP